jgi:hypothetical protein
MYLLTHMYKLIHNIHAYINKWLEYAVFLNSSCLKSKSSLLSQFLVLLWGTVSLCSQLSILRLPWPSEYWDYRHAPMPSSKSNSFCTWDQCSYLSSHGLTVLPLIHARNRRHISLALTLSSVIYQFLLTCLFSSDHKHIGDAHVTLLT